MTTHSDDLYLDDEQLELILCALNWAMDHPPDMSVDENLLIVQDWRRIERTISDYLYGPTTKVQPINQPTQEGR